MHAGFAGLNQALVSNWDGEDDDFCIILWTNKSLRLEFCLYTTRGGSEKVTAVLGSAWRIDRWQKRIYFTAILCGR